jgi:hypothetical protein
MASSARYLLEQAHSGSGLEQRQTWPTISQPLQSFVAFFPDWPSSQKSKATDETGQIEPTELNTPPKAEQKSREPSELLLMT